MTICQKTHDGMHKLEFHTHKAGEDQYLCLACGEIVHEFHDLGSGG